VKVKQIVKKAVKAFTPCGLLPLYHKINIARLKIQNLGTRIEVLKKTENKSPLFIVTLTSYGHRVKTTAPYAIHSILNP